MKIIVGSKKLLEKLQVLGGVINSNNTLPILDNVNFVLADGVLNLTASDLETTLSTSIKIDGAEGKFNIAVDAKIIVSVLKSLPNQPIIINVLENSTIEIKAESGA